MGLIRTIMAALIAISAALSPAIGETALSPAIGETAMSPAPVEVMTADQADMSCCPCCNTQDNFKSTACILKCVTLAGAVLPAISLAQPYLLDGLPLLFVDDTSHGVLRKPPTHPPPA
jgi:hypothetical protein